MLNKIIQSIFSLLGLSITIGCLGFLSSVVTLFVNVNGQISIKWILLILLSSGIAICILLKVIFDLSRVSKPQQPFETPIRFISDDQIFIIKRNDNFINSILVGCYIQQGDMEQLAFLGAVNHVQDKVIQIKVLRDYNKIQLTNIGTMQLDNIVIRAVVPMIALEPYSTAEVGHER